MDHNDLIALLLGASGGDPRYSTIVADEHGMHVDPAQHPDAGGDSSLPTSYGGQSGDPPSFSRDDLAQRLSSLDVGTPTMTGEQWNQPDAKSVDVSIGKPTLLNRDDGRGVSGVWQSADSQVEHHPATGVDVSMGQPQMLNEAVSANDPRASLLIQQQLAKAKALRQPPTQGQDEYAAATP